MVDLPDLITVYPSTINSNRVSLHVLIVKTLLAIIWPEAQYCGAGLPSGLATTFASWHLDHLTVKPLLGVTRPWVPYSLKQNTQYEESWSYSPNLRNVL